MTSSNKKPPVLEITVDTQATPEQVWEALTEPDRLASWFPLKSGGEPKPGGKVLLSWGSDCEWETNITVWEPGKHLRWMDMLPDPEKPDQVLPVVDFFIETQHGSTTVRLVQDGFDPESNWEAYYDGVRRGWTYFMNQLRDYLANHFQHTREMVWRRDAFGLERSDLWHKILAALQISLPEGNDIAGSSVSVNLLGDTPYQAQVSLIEAPHVLAVTIPDLQKASLFIELEPGGDAPTSGIWLSTYGLDASLVDQLQRGLDKVCSGIA